MKKIALILLLSLMPLLANEANSTEYSEKNITIQQLPTNNNSSGKEEINSTEANISISKIEENKTEINSSKTEIVKNVLPPLQEESIPAIEESYEGELDIAIILDKKKKTLFNFIPTLLNSINAYLIKKEINYHIKLFDMENNLTKKIEEIKDSYPYILLFVTEPSKIAELNQFPNNYFFIPTLYKNQVKKEYQYENVYFGGIDYSQQVKKLNKFIDGYTYIIENNSLISKYISSIVDKELLYPHKIISYPIPKYRLKQLNKSYLYLNINTMAMSELMQSIRPKIVPKLFLTTQIGYNPFLFSLIDKEDSKKIILANSISNINSIIEDNNLNLNSDINFNWLNYTTSVLLNEIYVLEMEENPHFLNDFDLYIFNNQVEYKTNLYKIYQNGFMKIE